MDLWYKTFGQTTFYVFMGSGSQHDKREVLVFRRDGNGSIRGGRRSNEVSRAQIENNGYALLIDDHLKSILEELRENGGMGDILEAADKNTLYWK